MENIDQSQRNWTHLQTIHQTARQLQMSTYLGKADDTELVMHKYYMLLLSIRRMKKSTTVLKFINLLFRRPLFLQR